MDAKKLIPCIYLNQAKAVAGIKNQETVVSENPVELAKFYSDQGADAILVFDFSSTDKEHDIAIGTLKEICRVSEVPVYGGGNIKRMEDVKKIIYAGAAKAFLNYSKEGNVELTKEVADKFGKDKIIAMIKDANEITNQDNIGLYILLDERNQSQVADKLDRPFILISTTKSEEELENTLKSDSILGVAGAYVSDTSNNLMALKASMEEKGIPMNGLKASIAFSELKLNADGLIPVIVQDYKTNEVLMLAYMNEESFHQTLRLGRMTYYSRSRQELWLKGETSGHYQYVKEISYDCDKDTLLAKISQVGAACHTGSYSCFYSQLTKTEYNDTDSNKVLNNVYDTIMDRKNNPKEGSYTNYLFEKGIDKILKKVGEEATEIVIAAKNPDAEEIKYEIADFLYHTMVLMAERGVTWDDIMRELADRH